MVLVHAAQMFRDPASRRSHWTVEVVTEYPDFVAMEGEWNALVDRARGNHPFLRHEWVRACWQSLSAGRRLHVLAVRSRDELVAIAPLVLTRERMYGVSVRTLRFIFNVHAPRLDLIVARSHRDVCRTLWRYLRERGSLWDVVEMHELPEGSHTVGELRRAAEEDGFPTGLWRTAGAPFLAREGTATDAYFFSRARRGRLIHWAKFRVVAALRDRVLTRRLVEWIHGRPPARPAVSALPAPRAVTRPRAPLPIGKA
jgi:hypothetical protein